jgi:iron-sulfur cluster assembly protein
MDRAADLLPEDVVDHAVLLDAGKTVEGLGDNRGLEVVAAPGPIVDLHRGAGNRRLDSGLDRGCVGHLRTKSRARRHGAILLEAMVSMTDKGAEKAREYLAAQGADIAVAGLRVGVRGGGCSGFQYLLAFDDQRDDDRVFESHGLKLLVDPAALEYVDGSQIDYIEALTGAGFKVENPNVVAACGCGSSFRVADQESCSPV